MEIKKTKSTIEAILFASGEPVEVDRLSAVLEIDKATVIKLIKEIVDKFDEDDSGICIVKLDDKYQMCSKPIYSNSIRAMLDLRRHVPLSIAAMEVLAIIAYNQPVTKSFVEQIRGVDCSGTISSLIIKDLIEEKGRLDLPGRPLLYGTTLNFLKCFNISSLDELPPLPDKEIDLITEKCETMSILEGK
ncbi:MAG: Segregation and condensation protein B [Eubacteriales bacterium SKADARSKE-1]|nr:Segregation and condensation protein B [Eubacteriales bacterium SKADARSKE-1]